MAIDLINHHKSTLKLCENHHLTRYMMMRRYVDASRTFQDILVFLSKISAVNSLSYQYDQMLKKQDPNRTKKYGTPGEASKLGMLFTLFLFMFYEQKGG